MDGSSKTTVAVLTPPGRGAIAVLAVDGYEALTIVEKWFRPNRPTPLSQRPQDTIVYGKWGDDPAEDVVAARRGSTRLEVHCHGGQAAIARIVSDLVSAGAIEQSWTDWIDDHERSPIASAAFKALAAAPTRRTAEILLDQYHGALEGALRTILDAIDRGDNSTADQHIDRLLACASVGLHLVHPWRIVIAGPPNVGKSSLANALLGYQRAIVFDQPGTTRDFVTASTAFDGWPVELIDTAGLRETEDELEAAGVRRAGEQLVGADGVLLVFDRSAPWSASCQQLVETWPHAIIIHNKSDLVDTLDESANSSPLDRPPGIAVSATTGAGLNSLIESLLNQIAPVAPEANQGVPFEAQHCARLEEAKKALLAGDHAQAANSISALLAKE